MKELKLEYNTLLASYNRGLKRLEEEPENEEKIMKGLDELKNKMESILNQIDSYTEEETLNGFKIENDSTEIVVNDINRDYKPIAKQEIKPVNNFLDTYQNNWDIAVQLSKSDIIPKEYQNKPQNVLVAIELSENMQLTPFLVMQNLGIINGKTSWNGSFCKYLIERTGKYKNLELNYIGTKGKDDFGCYLSAIRTSDGKEIKGPEITIATAKAEGWVARNKKWLNIPENMLAYRCQSFFARIYCPEALNGIYTSEEIEDIKPEIKEIKEVKDVL